MRSVLDVYFTITATVQWYFFIQALLLLFPLFGRAVCRLSLLCIPQAIVYSQRDAPEGTGPREQNYPMGAIRAGLNDDEFSDDDG